MGNIAKSWKRVSCKQSGRLPSDARKYSELERSPWPGRPLGVQRSLVTEYLWVGVLPHAASGMELTWFSVAFTLESTESLANLLISRPNPSVGTAVH